MAMVDVPDLLTQARKAGCCVPIFAVSDLAVLAGVIEAAEAARSPLILAARKQDALDYLLPALESAAKRTRVPAALLYQGAAGAEEAVHALRMGCNGISASARHADDIAAVMDGCGVSVIRDLDGRASTDLPGNEYLGVEFAENVQSPLPAVQGLVCWNTPEDASTPPFPEVSAMELTAHLNAPWVKAVHGEKSGAAGRTAAVRQAVAEAATPLMERLGAAGQADALLQNCQRWRPVEHLIVYNVEGDETEAERLAAEGRDALSRIPGVQATLSGRAVKADAKFQWCWLIRFAHPDVISSYRDHPDHVVYAGQRFRPLAADRISIDFALEDAAEGG